MMSVFAAQATIVAAAVSLAVLLALHILKPDLHPSRTMVSRYALGRYGWLMALCFASFGAASGSLFIALVPYMLSLLGRIGMGFLAMAAVGLFMAARFRMDPEGTPPARMSFDGRMHGIAFLIGVPSMVLAVLLLSLALGAQGSHALWPLLAITVIIWFSLVIMIAIMVLVGPGRAPDPTGPERFVGWPNRSFMVAYAAWLIVVAWPLARGLREPSELGRVLTSL